MLNSIYTLKACLLIMYGRLTAATPTKRYVKYLAIYVLLGYTSTQIAFFSSCRPFSGYWAVPPPNPQCTTLQRYSIVQGVFNITSDLMMLCIPLPMIVKLKLPLKQKIILSGVFSMGIFVVSMELHSNPKQQTTSLASII